MYLRENGVFLEKIEQIIVFLSYFVYNIIVRLYLHVDYKVMEELIMTVRYKKLWILLAHKEMSKAELRKMTGLSPTTFSKLNRNELVAMNVMIKICEVLKCDIGDIMEVVEADKSLEASDSPKALYY